MQKMKVKSIALNNFRGSTERVEISFNTDKALSLIFGENGTGKSTIVDGFDFLCNGNYGSLANYSIGTKAKSFLPAFGKKLSDCFVEVRSEGEPWRATFSADGITTSPNMNLPDARILRRQTILRLIELEPRKRFDELKAFISVPNVDKTESVFRNAIKDTEKIFNEHTRSLSQAKDTINVMWEQAGKTGQSALDWAQGQASIDTSHLSDENETIRRMQNLISYIEIAGSALEEAVRIELEAAEKETVAKKEQVVVENKKKDKDSELLLLLQKAQDYIHTHTGLNGCPVCETKLDMKNLIKQLGDRITEMDDVKTATVVTAQARSQAETKKSLRINAEEQYFRKLETFILFCQKTPKAILDLFEITQNFTNIFFEFTSYSDNLREAFIGWHNTYKKTIEAVVNARMNKNQESILLQKTILSHLGIVVEKESLAKTKEKTLSDLKELHKIIEKERKDYIENILVSISNDVADLYETLHPDEKIGKARFYLKPNAIGSLEFDASFQGKDEIPPQAYYSESHLDTLGICVFIALSKYYKTNSTILILDDVLTSVDAEHMDRFMQLLHDQSKIFNQIIVTTHYRPWRDRYRWMKGPSSNVDVIELGPWTLHHGIQAKQFLNAVEELREISSLENFDRQQAASKAGIVLESMLDFLTIQYKCLLPRNPQNEYTLGELVNGLDSRLSKLLKVKREGSEIALKEILDKSVNAQWIRNCVGCHFNSLGSEIADAEVREFLNSVIEVANALVCKSCNSLPKKNKSGSYLECNCAKLELYPLLRPSA
ncbi:hypothetical protein [Leptospira fluminis]|nr:hypothetical protein [Leptospira fluminis]